MPETDAPLRPSGGYERRSAAGVEEGGRPGRKKFFTADKIITDESTGEEGMMEYTEYVDPKYAEKIMAESLSMEDEPSRKGPASETAEPEPEAAIKESGH